MADTNQERLLNDVLRGIREADRGLGAADLEPQVLAAWDVRRRDRPAVFPAAAVTRPSTASRYGIVLAAAVLMALAWSVARTGRPDLPPVHRPAPLIAATNVPAALPADQSPIAQSPIAQSPIAQSPIAQSPIAQSPIDQSPMEFVPLMPLTPRELSGPFQIVRVQMPRASLGAIAPPLAYPNPLVEADLLLGEDGMARAIRVSSPLSVDPWRSR